MSRARKDGKEVRIYENFDELSTDLAEYIAELSEASVKERGVFAIALSGGSLISLMGYVSALSFCFLICLIFIAFSFFPYYVLCSLLICFRIYPVEVENCLKPLTTKLLTGLSGIYSGLMSALWLRLMQIAITN